MNLLEIYSSEVFQTESEKALKSLSARLGIETGKYNERLIGHIKEDLYCYIMRLNNYQFLEKYYEIDDVKFRVEFSYRKTGDVSIQIIGIPEVLIPIDYQISYELNLFDANLSEKLSQYHPDIYEDLIVLNKEELIESYNTDKIYSSNIRSWVVDSNYQNRKELVYAFLAGSIPIINITRDVFTRNEKGNWLVESEENISFEFKL